MKNFITLILIIAALAGGWFLRDKFGGMSMSGAPASGERKVLFYQSAMHPWICLLYTSRCV